MRKLLLAGVAVIGPVGLASAQTTPAPMPMAPLGYPTQPSSFLGGNNSLNSSGAALPAARARRRRAALSSTSTGAWRCTRPSLVATG